MTISPKTATSTSTSLDTISCPVCHSNCANSPIYKYSVAEAAAHFCPPTRNRERNQRLNISIERLWKSNECSIIQCHECGFAFGYPYIGGDEQFYGILHEQYGYPSWRWDYDIALENIIKTEKKGRILDIGAGTGNFLKSLNSEWETYAVEGSDTTRMELEKVDIQVFPSLAELVSSHPNTFQVVTMFQVLEHIAEFPQILKQCHQLLLPQGKLLITVPDGQAMLMQEKITGCPDMPPNHINKWTPKSLSLALEKVGFKVESIIHEPPAWKNLIYALQLKIMHEAARNSNSIVANIYRISNKNIRVFLFALLAPLFLLQLIPHFSQLIQGESFAAIASKESLN